MSTTKFKNSLRTTGNLTVDGNSTTTGSVTHGTTVQGSSVTTAAATGTTNQTLVTITVKDGAGSTVTRVTPIRIYLSDSATGEGITATTASGAVGAGASGTDLVAVTAKKVIDSLTNSSGVYVLAITDTAKTGFYPCVVIGQKLVVGTQLVTGNYG